MSVVHRITPCLWFDDQAEEAVAFYTAIFRNSQIIYVARYGEAGYEVHGKSAGTVMAVAFELDGQAFTALNGGPMFTFNEAISFQVNCDTQGEVDYYWEKLSAGGDEQAQRCGWLKDRYGVSWQVVPGVLLDMIKDPDAAKSQRTMEAMLQMKKEVMPVSRRLDHHAVFATLRHTIVDELLAPEPHPGEPCGSMRSVRDDMRTTRAASSYLLISPVKALLTGEPSSRKSPENLQSLSKLPFT